MKYSVFLSLITGDKVLCVCPAGVAEFFSEYSIPAPFERIAFDSLGEAEKALERSGGSYVSSPEI